MAYRPEYGPKDISVFKALIILLTPIAIGTILGSLMIREKPPQEDFLEVQEAVSVEEQLQNLDYLKIKRIKLKQNAACVLLYTEKEKQSQCIPISLEEKRAWQELALSTPASMHIPDYIAVLLPHTAQEMYTRTLFQLDPACPAQLVQQTHDRLTCSTIGIACIVHQFQQRNFPNAPRARIYAHKALFAKLEAS